MSSLALNCLKETSSFLNAQPGTLSLSDDSMPIRTVGTNTNKGFINVTLALLKESPICNNLNLTGSGDAEKADVHQWLEYCAVYAIRILQNINQILDEINNGLAVRTYLAANKLTIADIVLYYILFSFVQKFTYVEKEKYINICRWFDNIQQNSNIRQSNSLVNFSSNYVVKVCK